MTTSTPTSPRVERRVGPVRAELEAMLLATAIAAIAALLLTQRAPTFVDGIAVSNPSDYQVRVEVRASADAAWSPLTTVDRGTDRVVPEVFDVGAQWTFRFVAQGVEAGEVQFARADLEAAGWSVVVPAAVIDRLHAAGVPASPCPRFGSVAGPPGCS
jgi:hypothetical protein